MFPLAVPVPGEIVVTVMKTGPAVFENASAFPSASVATIFWSAVPPSVTVMSAIAARTGADWHPSHTVIVNAPSAFRLPSLARTVAPAVPASANPGARWIFPVVGEVVVTLMYVGPATLENASASPSGSDPVIAWSRVALSGTIMFETGNKVGARFTPETVIVNPLLPDSEPLLAWTK